LRDVGAEDRALFTPRELLRLASRATMGRSVLDWRAA
jgi:hypothetical protein